MNDSDTVLEGLKANRVQQEGVDIKAKVLRDWFTVDVVRVQWLMESIGIQKAYSGIQTDHAMTIIILCKYNCVCKIHYFVKYGFKNSDLVNRIQ